MKLRNIPLITPKKTHQDSYLREDGMLICFYQQKIVQSTKNCTICLFQEDIQAISHAREAWGPSVQLGEKNPIKSTVYIICRSCESSAVSNVLYVFMITLLSHDHMETRESITDCDDVNQFSWVSLLQ